MYFLFVLTTAAVLFEDSCALSSSRTLPENWSKCRQSDLQVGDCLKNAVQDTLEKIKTEGAPTLRVPRLEPFKVSELHLDPGTPPNAPINVKITFHDMLIYGMGSSLFTDAKVNLKEKKMVINAFSRNIVFESDYVAKGRMLIVPFSGKGRCNITMADMITSFEFQFKPETKNEETFWRINQLNVHFNPKKMTMKFDGLFNGDKALADSFNMVVNDNWEDVLQVIRPGFEESFSIIAREIANRVFTKVPIKKIFPE